MDMVKASIISLSLCTHLYCQNMQFAWARDERDRQRENNEKGAKHTDTHRDLYVQ